MSGFAPGLGSWAAALGRRIGMARSAPSQRDPGPDSETIEALRERFDRGEIDAATYVRELERIWTP